MASKIFLVAALIATIIPASFVLHKAGGMDAWQGVVARGTTDSLYYYARIHEVTDGHPLIGHPYIYEYRDQLAPSLFLPDIVSAAPALLGIPFNIALWVNVFVWAFLFLYLAYRLLKLLELPEHWAILWSILLYVSSYAFMLRPVAMQIVFPLFLFFLITLLQYLKEPLSRRRGLWLAVASALAFYAYNYLGLVVFGTLSVVFLSTLFTRPFRELRVLVSIGLYTGLLLIPFGIYSLMQARGPWYEETVRRIGLVHTHVPPLEAFLFGRWIIFGLGALTLLWFFFLRKREENYFKTYIFWIATGAALFVGLFLNVFTGVEAFFAIHLGRFVTLWTTVLLATILYMWSSQAPWREWRSKWFGHGVVAVLVLLLVAGTARNLPRALAYFEFDARGYPLRELQGYAGPLSWLHANVPHESVIWSNLSIADYVPILTRHYTLFSENAVLHAMPSEELEERYLLSRSLEELTLDDLKQEFGTYAGAGPSQEEPLAKNNRVRFCNLLSRIVERRPCGAKTDGVTLRGEEYFKELLETFGRVQKDREDLLRKYGVEYLVVDTLHDVYRLDIPPSAAVYRDERFLIFPVPAIVTGDQRE